MSELVKYLEQTTVMPVITVHSVDSAIKLCRALQAGGINAAEITLRTEPGLASIQAVKAELPDMVVAAGTVTTERDMAAVQEAGADLAVSPGMTPKLIKAAGSADFPFLPGVATPSEVLIGMELGLEYFKLFPAVAVGGLKLLKSMADPFAGVKFCPTGGLNLDNFNDFLALPNVICVGGSWMVKSEMVATENWEAIESAARQTVEKTRK